MVCGKPERTMTAAEVADLLGVSEETVKRWISSGELRAYRLGGREEKRVREVDLEKFLRTREGLAEGEARA